MNDPFKLKNSAFNNSLQTPLDRHGSSRLLRRTFIIVFFLISGGLITSSLVELLFRHRESIKGIETLQREMAQGAAFKIQLFVEDIENAMRSSTQTREIVSVGLTDTFRFELIKLLKNTPAITEATAINRDGREQIKMSRTQMVQAEDRINRSTDEAFVHALSGASYFGPVYFVRASEPYMRIAVPIEKFAGSVIGVLVAQVNLKYIWDVVSQIKVGQKGYAYVVSREGDLIAHPDISLVLQKRNISDLGQVKSALSGTFVASNIQTNLEGKKVLTAYAFIPDVSWAVLVERPATEAYEMIYSSVLRTVILLFFGLGLSAVASFLIIRRVVTPIETLRNGAAQIGAGSLKHRIDIKTGDELEDLAQEFNSMAFRLEEAYASLEQKVQKRTQELMEANQSLEKARTDLEEWNQKLEAKVQIQVNELERASRMKRFLSPQVAEAVLNSDSIDPFQTHRREITVVFIDLRGFTNFSDGHEPEEVMQFLKKYHEEIGNFIFKFEGTLEHFAGDGIMVFFNDPFPREDHTELAIRMSIAVQIRIKELRPEWHKKGYELDVGIGIATGFATLGTIGFKGRIDYGAIGNVTILASRLCSEAQGGQILTEQKTLAKIENIVEAESLGKMQLKGFARPVSAFNIKNLK